MSQHRDATTTRRWSGRHYALPAVAAALIGAVWPFLAQRVQGADQPAGPAATAPGKIGPERVRIAPNQLASFDVGAVGTHEFRSLQQALGNIDFDQDRSAAVYPAYQGRIARVLVKAGDEVKAGQLLYTVAVPDIAQAASALITSAGTLKASNDTLKRAQVLAQDDSIPQRELQQNRADQQSAQAAYDTARKTLRLFGLEDAEVSRIEREHAIDVEMPVRSPFAGRVAARNAQPGLIAQPGVAPAPVTVADMRTLWMVASVPESEFARYRLGQRVAVKVPAWPGRSFDGKLSYLGDQVDPATHRIVVRADVDDPGHALRPQMLAEFSITTETPQTGVGVPATAVVRESDGRSAVWVAAGDERGTTFVRRRVQTGRSDQGQVQIVDGVTDGERIVRRNALFLSNLYEAGAD